MRKILLYIDNLYLGGAQRVMANLADHFKKIGLEVAMVNDFNPQSDKKAYPIDGSIKRYYLGFETNGKITKQIHRICELRKIILSEQPDVVLSFLGPTNLRLLISTIGLSAKKFVSVRNDPYREYGSGIKRKIARSLFRLADGCIFQTEQAAQYFSSGVQEKSRVIFNPVAEAFYNIDRSNVKKEIVAIGRLQQQKNPMMLLEAFGKIAYLYKDYQLIYYGEGELQLGLEERSKELGIREKVVFAGQTSNIPEKLNTAGIFVLSSDFEGMPNALMEAMAAGVPVIATDCPCGGPRSLITSPKEGILVPCGDVDAMAIALNELLQSENLRNEMERYEKLRANSFRPECINQKWEQFLFSD